MKKPRANSTATALRERAEERLRAASAAGPPTAEEKRRQLHELQVHQIELEMQNEELVAARASLEAALEKYADLFDFAPVSYLTLDPGGTIREANLTAATFLGVPRAQLIGRRFGLFVAAECRAALATLLDATATSDAREPCELTLEKSGDGQRLVRIQRTAIPGTGGLSRIVIIDSTQEQREAAKIRRLLAETERGRRDLLDALENQRLVKLALLESEARLIEAQAVANVGSWETKLPGLQVSWTAQTHRIYETDPAVFQPTHPRFLEFVHPEDRAKVDAAFVSSLGQHSPRAIEHRIVMADGRVKIVEERWLYFHNDQGVTARAVGTCQDITERKLVETKLQQSEERLRLMIECIKDYAIIQLDTRGLVVSWNRGAARIEGYEAVEIIGQHFSRFYPPEAVADGLPDRMLAEALAKDSSQHEGWRVRKDGSRFWGNVVITALRDAAGRHQGFVKLTRDMTEHREAEEAFRRANATLQSIFDAAPVAVLGFDLQGRTSSWSRGAERLLGWTAAEALGKVCLSVPEELVPDFLAMITRVVKSGPEKLVRTRQNKNGECIHACLNPAPLLDATGKALGVMVILEDVTEQIRSQAELDRSARQLRAHARQLLAAQETERRRIARELHDQVGQALTLLQLGLHNTLNLGTVSAMAHELDHHAGAVGEILEEVRNISLDLRPSMLDDLGLVPALRWYADRVGRAAKLEVSLEVGRVPEQLPGEIETACFRTAQEALTNVLRHARARSARIRLGRENGTLILTVSDDGCGFDLVAARQRAAGGGSMGLFTMEERVTPVGGGLVLESAPGMGTVVRATFPLPTPKPADS